jgi:hypothetical protein
MWQKQLTLWQYGSEKPRRAHAVSWLMSRCQTSQIRHSISTEKDIGTVLRAGWNAHNKIRPGPMRIV